MAGTPLSAEKPVANIAVLGARGHGKSTLTGALSDYRDPAGASVDQVCGLQDTDWHCYAPPEAEPPARARCEGRKRSYRLFDAKGKRQARDLILCGARMGGAVVVVAADEGPNAETREQVRLAHLLGTEHLVVFLSKADQVADEPGLLGLAEYEARCLLAEFEYPADEIPIISGNVKAAAGVIPAGRAGRCLGDLLDALDACAIPSAPNPADGPFLMPITDTFGIHGRGTVVTGRIARGRLRVGDLVEIVGLAPQPQTTVATAVERFQEVLQWAGTGEDVGVLLRGLNRSGLSRGQVLAAPQTVRAYTHFEAVVHLYAAAEGGRQSALYSGYSGNLVMHTASVDARLTLRLEQDTAAAGTVMPVSVDLLPDRPMALETGTCFLLTEGGRSVGCGVVTAVRK